MARTFATVFTQRSQAKVRAIQWVFISENPCLICFSPCPPRLCGFLWLRPQGCAGPPWCRLPVGHHGSESRLSAPGDRPRFFTLPAPFAECVIRPEGDPEIRARVAALLESGQAELCAMVGLELWNGTAHRALIIMSNAVSPWPGRDQPEGGFG